MTSRLALEARVDATHLEEADRPRNVLRRGLAIAAVMVASLLSFCQAAGAQTQSSPHVTVAFRLHVSGLLPDKATFWVAYGPIDGRFWVVRLRRSVEGTFGTRRSLPSDGTSDFTYLVGRGTVSTPAGPAPGNPVTVIRTFGHVSADKVARARVVWHLTAG
jgi:hypothetical protein